MKRAGLYARVSKKEQQKGWSIDSQLEACREYATREGWGVTGEYIDVHSAYREGEDEVSLRRPRSAGGEYALVGEWGLVRPNLYRLLVDAEDELIDVVIVWKADRLSRKSGAQDLVRDFLDKLGVRLISVTDGIDTAGRRNLAHERNISTQSQAESERISERTQMAKKARAKAGYTNASRLPYGYRRERIGRKTWADPAPDPELIPAVIAAFEAYATGQYTDQEIADLLYQKGFPTYGRRAKRWTRGAARKMLQNPYYAGWVNYRDELHKGQHEPIIEQELWDAAQLARERRSSGAAGGHTTTRIYLLHRIARCWHCGALLHMYPSGKGHFYYRDPARINALDCPVAGRSVPMATIDDQVGDLVRRLQLPDDWRERLQELAEHREEREKVEGKRLYVEAKLRRLRELYVEGDYTKLEYDRRRADLQAQLDALLVPDAPAVEEAGETLESLGAEWANAPKRYQRDMLGLIFEAVLVDVEGQRVVCVKPYPPFLPLFRMDGLEEVEDGCFRVREEGQEAGSEG